MLGRCEREVVEGCHAGRRRLKPVMALHKGEGISCGWPRIETGALRGEQTRHHQQGHGMVIGMLLSGQGQSTVPLWTRPQDKS